jgi:hypothetical protein
MKLLRLILVATILACSFPEPGLWAQALTADSMQTLIRKIQRGENDSVRFQSNRLFTQILEDTLKSPASFDADFSSWKNLSVVSDAEHTLRIYTWTFPNYSGSTYNYNGYIQLKLSPTDSLITIALADSTSKILKPESEKLRAERWLGAVYYSIGKTKRSGVTYFTLLGWKGTNQSMTKKVIEVMSIEDGHIKFGYPILKTGSVFRNRVIFTFTAQASMTLRFEKDGKEIVFDHISNPKKGVDPDLNLLSGPDGTYDKFRLKGGRWVIEKDIDARTDWESTKTFPQPPVEEKSEETK